MLSSLLPITGYLLIHMLQIEFLQEPFHRLFFISNINLQYPHAEVERVPPGWNIVYAGCIPFVILALTLGILRAGVHKSHVTLLGFLIRSGYFEFAVVSS